MPVKISVIVKDSDKTNTNKYLNYNDTDGSIFLSKQCERLKSMVSECVANFKGTPEQIIVRADFVWE